MTAPTAKAQREWRRKNPGRAARYAKEYRGRSPETGRKWREENATKLKEDSYGWRRKNPAKALRANMVNAARQRGQECTISLEDIEQLLESMVCSVTGLQLTWTGPDRNNFLAPSPDRIDTSKGYVLGNVRIVCWMYNRARGSNTDEDVLMMAKALVEKEKDLG